MIPNCEGCQEELQEAYYQQTLGNHVATCKDYPMSENIGKRGHYALIIVNNKGKVIMW